MPDQQSETPSPEEEKEAEREQQRQIQKANWLRVEELGNVLGLDEDFIRSVQEQGPTALVNRAESVDETGVQAMVLEMALEYGAWLDEAAKNRDKAPSIDEKVDIMSQVSRKHDIDPDSAIFVLGALEEEFSKAADQIRRTSIHNKMRDTNEEREVNYGPQRS